MDLEEQRLIYPLDANSIVVDVGGYHGKYAREIWAKYHCKVFVFEPVKAFFDQYLATLGRESNGQIEAYNYGLGTATMERVISVREDSSGFHLDSEVKDTAKVVEVSAAFRELGLTRAGMTRVDLMKINIEGDEYGLIEHMFWAGLLPGVKYLQVQFHTYGAGPEGPEVRRNKVREKLQQTHDCMWEYPFIWESWSRR